MAESDADQIYVVIGEDGFRRLVAAFYARVRSDDLLGPLYPEADFAGAEERLREFLIQRFGGPARYSQARGHPRLRMRHAPFPLDQAMRDRWVQLMESAVKDANLPEAATLLLKHYFRDTATFLINR